MAAIRLWVTLAVSWLMVNPVFAQTPIDPALCHCYLTDKESSATFAHHKFFDFRDLPGAGVSDLIDDRDGSTNAPVTNEYFNSSNWTDTWAITNYIHGSDDATVWQTFSRNNLYVESNTDTSPGSNTYLTLRTVRHANNDFQSSAEIESASATYQYLSIRMYARTRGAAGGVTAMFTYRANDIAAGVQEADLEIRTQESNKLVSYTNQPSLVNGIPRLGATRNISLSNQWTEWQEHRFDWTPGSSDWYANDELAASIQFQTPIDPTSVLFKTWSDGGSWSGVMAVGGIAEMQIQWIDFLYNNTAEPSEFASCANMCSVDLSPEVGVPVLVS
ncbi:glycoside hydrolase family 16 protein [Whalleya microplaca]|nr:glycoside hydrolase family 16 protein [Whalleya microplaca]